MGQQAIQRLRQARVIVFGVGGVGGYVVEALARSGIGALDLVDSNHTVKLVPNLNRQIIATHSTLGQYKVDAAADRIRDIDPTIQVQVYRMFVLPENLAQFDFGQYDYIVDAIDTVSAKLALAQAAQQAGVPILCAMGAGNKMDPTRFEVADIYDTSVCPLAKVMRTECRKRGVRKLKVVYSREPALPPAPGETPPPAPGSRRATPGSNAFVPAAAGLVLAGELIPDVPVLGREN